MQICKNILITGANGFLGKNLYYHLKDNNNFRISFLLKNERKIFFIKKILNADFIFHFAGTNKGNKKDFYNNNYLLTKKICSVLKKKRSKTSIIFTSTIHVLKKNNYGRSKLLSEKEILKLRLNSKIDILIYRLPNIFGKWCKPFYNSVVATFSYLTSRNKKLTIINPKKKLKLLYIDDLIHDFMKILNYKKKNKFAYRKIKRIYNIRVEQLVKIFESFQKLNKIILPMSVTSGLKKKIYSTYLSYLQPRSFAEDLKLQKDSRGSFVEFLKNHNFGQISFFSILPKKLRGGHYHNTKVEKFVLLKGVVKFIFTNILNKKKYTFIIKANKPKTIITIPGWAHTIQNMSNTTAYFIVWANEVFNLKKPDTILYKKN
jgi:UDP-2-acetamido-2,6-beta-L-arabino-hexul-4-ose reductase